MSETHFYEPRHGHGLPHDPFKAIVAPRPIGWVSTVDPEGRPNLAPYSFFNAFCEAPPLVGFSSGGPKDSLRNAEATGEFVVNLATRRHAEAMNRTSAPFPPGVSEFEAAGLAAAPSRRVRPPRVADAPAALECKVVLVLPLKGQGGAPTPSTLVLGEVVGVHIDPAFLKGGLFDLVAAGTIARCGYRGDYTQVTSLFEMPRPAAGEAVRRGPARPLLAEVSAGDLLDRLTILQIKSERIRDPAKLRHVRAELAALAEPRQDLGESPELATLAARLREVNERLWDAEDELRLCERRQDFGPRFVELARSVYQTNDRRTALKRAVNELLQSPLVEEKSYAGPEAPA